MIEAVVPERLLRVELAYRGDGKEGLARELDAHFFSRGGEDVAIPRLGEQPLLRELGERSGVLARKGGRLFVPARELFFVQKQSLFRHIFPSPFMIFYFSCAFFSSLRRTL